MIMLSKRSESPVLVIKYIQRRLEFAEPVSVMDWIRVHGCEDAFTPRSHVEKTTAAPGSPEKVEVLAQRVLAGQELFVEGDPQVTISNKSFWSSDAWTEDDE